MADLWMDNYLNWILWDELNYRNAEMHLMRRLHNMEFLWTNVNDRRRAADGTALRRRFPEYDRFNPNDKKMPCSVLEMLAALAIRIDKEWIGNARENRAYIPFQDMIGNLELDPKNFYNNINDWMYRRFDYDGYGSIFPLKHPDCDQRNIQIWAQMVRYIDENY